MSSKIHFKGYSGIYKDIDEVVNASINFSEDVPFIEIEIQGNKINLKDIEDEGIFTIIISEVQKVHMKGKYFHFGPDCFTEIDEVVDFYIEQENTGCFDANPRILFNAPIADLDENPIRNASGIYTKI